MITSGTNANAGGKHDNGNHGRASNTTYTGSASASGAAKKPKSAAQERPPYQLPCGAHNYAGTPPCPHVRDQRSGEHRPGHYQPDISGPAGGPNNRKPPS